MGVFNIYIIYKKKQKYIYIIPKIFQWTPIDVLTFAAYRDITAAAYKYRYQGPIWVDDIDPVWITIAPRLGHTEITVSYSDSTFGYIQIENSDSTFGYIQFSPVSTSMVFAGMNIKENEKYM